MQTGIHIRNKHCHSLLDRESRKKPYFPVFNLSRKNKAKTETTLLPYLFSIKRNENKIFNKVIIHALIHFPSTKVYKKNKVFK